MHARPSTTLALYGVRLSAEEADLLAKHVRSQLPADAGVYGAATAGIPCPLPLGSVNDLSANGEWRTALMLDGRVPNGGIGLWADGGDARLYDHGFVSGFEHAAGVQLGRNGYTGNDNLGARMTSMQKEAARTFDECVAPLLVAAGIEGKVPRTLLLTRVH